MRSLILVILSAAAFGPSPGGAYRPPGSLVDVGGHFIHVDCSGTGTPTVVLEGGAGAGFSFDWALVQPEVARSTRVCSYDRAGYAWSDPGPVPRTLAQLALELHAALRAAGEKPPFVLVGHSFGALVVREFAERYRRASAGFVFVDGTHEDSSLLLNNKVVRLRDLSRHRPLPSPEDHVNKREAAKPLSPASGLSLQGPFDRLPAQAQEWRRAALALDYQRTAGSEFDFLPEEMEILARRRRATPFPLGDKPLVVVSAATRHGPTPPGIDEADWRRLNDEKTAQQTDLSRLSRNSASSVSREDVHEVQIVEPGLVTAAIDRVIHALRCRRRLEQP